MISQTNLNEFNKQQEIINHNCLESMTTFFKELLDSCCGPDDLEKELDITRGDALIYDLISTVNEALKSHRNLVIKFGFYVNSELYQNLAYSELCLRGRDNLDFLFDSYERYFMGYSIYEEHLLEEWLRIPSFVVELKRIEIMELKKEIKNEKEL